MSSNLILYNRQGTLMEGWHTSGKTGPKGSPVHLLQTPKGLMFGTQTCPVCCQIWIPAIFPHRETGGDGQKVKFCRRQDQVCFFQSSVTFCQSLRVDVCTAMASPDSTPMRDSVVRNSNVEGPAKQLISNLQKPPSLNQQILHNASPAQQGLRIHRKEGIQHLRIYSKLHI